MSGAPLAHQCIRCGSREHSTREHDEQKAGKPAEKPKPKRAATAVPDAKRALLYRDTKIQHPKCFKTSLKPVGIPDIIDAKIPDRFFKEANPESWFHRALCECADCQKKVKKRNIDNERRIARSRLV